MAQPKRAGTATNVHQEVMSFRMVELQQVAEMLHIKKGGRKSELQARILACCGEIDPSSVPAAALGRAAASAPQPQSKKEAAAKAVHAVYRRMLGLPATAPSDQSAHSSLQLSVPGGAAPSQPAPPPQQPVSPSQRLRQQQLQQQQLQQQQQQQLYATYTPMIDAMHQQMQLLDQAAAVQPYGTDAFLQHMYRGEVPVGAFFGYGHERQLPAEVTQQDALMQQMVRLQQQQQQQQRQQQSTAPAPAANGAFPGLVAGHAGAFAASQPKRVRCLCDVRAERGVMVKCQGKGCGVWQHADCVGLAHLSAMPPNFLCEVCRAKLADPFWEPTLAVLPPTRLKTQLGMQGLQQCERIFYLNQQQLEAVQRDPENHRVEAGCLLVGDEVPERYHWPRMLDLKINNLPHRPYGRALNAKMGINQRDDVASIGSMVVRGRNSLVATAAEGGTWVLTLQLARKRSLAEVKGLMAAPEPLCEATARVRRQVSGGNGDESDEDLLVSHQVVSLKDPMSGQRMQVPARFRDASGLQAFDLDSLLSMAQRNRKWQDPTTLKNSTVEQLQVDSFTQQVLQCLQSRPAITDVEISAEGRWRPDGSSGEWFDIAAEPASVAAALAAPAAAAGAGGGAAAAAGAGAGTKPDPDAPANGSSGGGGGKVGGEELVVSDSEEEEDAGEELRKAAAAVRDAASKALIALAGQKRKPEPEVIDLLSSDDEGGQAPLAGRTSAQQQQQQQQQQRPAVHPLRIRLPARPRRPEAGAAPSAADLPSWRSVAAVGGGSSAATGGGPWAPPMQQQAPGSSAVPATYTGQQQAAPQHHQPQQQQQAWQQAQQQGLQQPYRPTDGSTDPFLPSLPSGPSGQGFPGFTFAGQMVSAQQMQQAQLLAQQQQDQESQLQLMRQQVQAQQRAFRDEGERLRAGWSSEDGLDGLFGGQSTDDEDEW
ncbi:hypothetical protein D9Q98_007864 [Chlorella vulgaris]|uniref:SP-RING-type domain-containing protein n=1 Tax=Chlorella vulgaris TaxID=3077 RepID=A0A9D4THM4_CHLVU|nr:hypothetical protein D9Q98_007864 [Chlorella vulgaris]